MMMWNNQPSEEKFVNVTLQEVCKDIVREIVSFLYRRPKIIFSILKNPSQLDGPTYFPNEKRKSKRRILLDQIINIIKYEDIEHYYYLYGKDIIGKNNRGGESFTPYMKFLRRRNRLNFRSEHNSSGILRNKLFFGAVAKSIGIPTPENVLLTICNSEEVVNLAVGESCNFISILQHLHGTFFCKPLRGECGSGIVKLVISPNNQGYGELGERRMAFSEIADSLSATEYLIQRKISQHPVLQSLYPLSINTIRLVTVRDVNSGNIEVFPSVLRMGNLGNSVDNFSLGGVIVNLDIDSGDLEKIGFMKSEYGTIMEKHPYTGVVFSGITIPYMKEAVEMAKKFHSFLDIHSVGWDIAITETGPCFIEGNDNWEIDVQQNALHPLNSYFTKYFYKK